MAEIKLEDIIKDAAKQQIAADIVNSLDEEAKRKIISETLENIIGSYKFPRLLENSLEEEATRVLHEYISTPEVKQRIREKVISATDKFIDGFQQAFLVKIINMFEKPGSRDYENPEFHKALKKILGLPEKNHG